MINLWYDYIFSNRLVSNAISKELRDQFYTTKTIGLTQVDTTTRCDSLIPNFLANNKVSFNIKTSAELPYQNANFEQFGNKNFYAIEPFWFSNKTWNLKIDDESNFFINWIERLNGEILIWFPNEGFYSTYLKFFDDIIKKLPNTKIRFVFCNLQRPNWLDKYPNVIYKSFDYWWYRQTLIPKKILNIDKEEQYDFVFYNRRFKINRAIIYYSLLQTRKLDNARHGFHGLYGSKQINGMTDDQAHKIIEYLIDESENYYKLGTNSKITNILSDIEWRTWAINKLQYGSKQDIDIPSFDYHMNTEMNNDSYLDLIMETDGLGRSGHLLISEKTYRPIASGCIFLHIGCPGTLKYLRSQGIETFGDIFDESYDNEGHIHWYDRWKIIENNLDIWRSLGKKGRQDYYLKNFEKLKHNQHVIYSKNFKKEIEDLFL